MVLLATALEIKNGESAMKLDALKKILPAERILTAAEDIIPYSFDGTAALS